MSKIENCHLVFPQFYASADFLRFTAFPLVVIMENLLKHYLDPKSSRSLGIVDWYYRQVADKVPSKKKARELLEQSDVYTVTKEARRRFWRNKILVTNLRQQYQADLADVKKYKKEKEGIQYLLVVVDCFSRKVRVVLLKDKTGAEVKDGLHKVFVQLDEPEKLQTDRGKEFFNSVVQGYLKKHKVWHFTAENDDIKWAMAERFIRIL